jgi:hypothetical protein
MPVDDMLIVLCKYHPKFRWISQPCCLSLS